MKRIEIQDLTAVILAGGLGTRLRSTIPDLPKALAKVDGRPFITYIFDQLHETGIKEIVLCTGYLGDAIKRTFGDKYRSISLKYSQEHFPYVQKSRSRKKQKILILGLYIGVGGMAAGP